MDKDKLSCLHSSGNNSPLASAMLETRSQDRGPSAGLKRRGNQRSWRLGAISRI